MEYDSNNAKNITPKCPNPTIRKTPFTNALQFTNKTVNTRRTVNLVRFYITSESRVSDELQNDVGPLHHAS